MVFLTVTPYQVPYLVVSLDGLWQGLVDDKSDIRLVNAHTKGDSSTDHPNTVLKKQFHDQTSTYCSKSFVVTNLTSIQWSWVWLRTGGVSPAW
jgi:hypothetical protein